MNGKILLSFLLTLLLVERSHQQQARREACRVLCGGGIDDGPFTSSSEEDEIPEMPIPIAGRWGRPSRPPSRPPTIRGSDWKLTGVNTRLIPQPSRPSQGSRWSYGWGGKK